MRVHVKWLNRAPPVAWKYTAVMNTIEASWSVRLVFEVNPEFAEAMPLVSGVKLPNHFRLYEGAVPVAECTKVEA